MSSSAEKFPEKSVRMYRVAGLFYCSDSDVQVMKAVCETVPREICKDISSEVCNDVTTEEWQSVPTEVQI